MGDGINIKLSIVNQWAIRPSGEGSCAVLRVRVDWPVVLFRVVLDALLVSG